MPDTPDETLHLPRGVLSRIRESDAGQMSQAVTASLEHLKPWMPWATPQAASMEAQRTHSREAEEAWDAGSDYIYVL
ncbi:MAG TPA: hypothetical protein VFV41_21355, partial [Streptosporangiaceae bacterium]|nr:hypothetical protein [Streptosporangiaceae bacterium]